MKSLSLLFTLSVVFATVLAGPPGRRANLPSGVVKKAASIAKTALQTAAQNALKNGAKTVVAAAQNSLKGGRRTKSCAENIWAGLSAAGIAWRKFQDRMNATGKADAHAAYEREKARYAYCHPEDNNLRRARRAKLVGKKNGVNGPTACKCKNATTTVAAPAPKGIRQSLLNVVKAKVGVRRTESMINLRSARRAKLVGNKDGVNGPTTCKCKNATTTVAAPAPKGIRQSVLNVVKAKVGGRRRMFSN